MLSDNLGPHDDVALLEVGHLNELQIPYNLGLNLEDCSGLMILGMDRPKRLM